MGFYSGRIIPPLLVALLLVCCSTGQRAFYETAVAPLALRRASLQAVNEQTINRIPYPSLKVTRQNGGEALLILGQLAGNHQYWFSHDHEALVVVEGLVVHTAGLEHNLVGLRYHSTFDPTKTGLAKVAEHNTAAYGVLDLMPSYRIAVPFKAYFEPQEEEAIHILGRPHLCRKIKQTVDVPSLGWRVANLFWVDRVDGTVWQSEQQFHPDEPPLRYQLQKKPAIG